jgi:hypothetical protein
MKSFATSLFAAAVGLLMSANSFAQDIVRAISLGDPIPVFQADPNIVPVNGSSCSSCSAKSESNACRAPANACANGREKIVPVACSGDCKAQAPACAVAAKPCPCKACEIVKQVCHAPIACCSACAAARPAPIKIAAKPCDTGCAKPSHVSCASCDSCGNGPSGVPHMHAQAAKRESSRPILDGLKNFFSGHAFQTASAKSEPQIAPLVTLANPIPVESVTTLPQPASHQLPAQPPIQVPAALAPFASQAPFSTSVPQVDTNAPAR